VSKRKYSTPFAPKPYTILTLAYCPAKFCSIIITEIC
jgi:hypothetical protein